MASTANERYQVLVSINVKDSYCKFGLCIRITVQIHNTTECVF